MDSDGVVLGLLIAAGALTARSELRERRRRQRAASGWQAVGPHVGPACRPGRHVVKDDRVTCECSAVSVVRDENDDVIVTIYNNGGA